MFFDLAFACWVHKESCQVLLGYGQVVKEVSDVILGYLCMEMLCNEEHWVVCSHYWSNNSIDSFYRQEVLRGAVFVEFSIYGWFFSCVVVA